MEKLESENVSLKDQVQYLIQERENVKTEYKKLFDSIKKTRAQTQGEINELIENVKQKTYAYAEVRSQIQELLITISELRAKLKDVKKRMYKVGTSQVTNTNKTKSVLSSTGLSATSSVRRSSNRDSSFKDSVVSNTKNSAEKVEVSNRIIKKPDVASKNTALNTFVTNDEIKMLL
ncbi:hypothetical protein Tco_1094673 [Tanacetum coccineum]|uniref:Uncharacterized protein n=1 Tax=Tanacetum coccineum TaxID=301880 RepID=A0ABQ5IG57_9ASTR